MRRRYRTRAPAHTNPTASCAAFLLALPLFALPLRAEITDDIPEAPTQTESFDDASADLNLSGNEYADLSLEELTSVQVTSIAGVAASSFQTPAAITVLSNQQINRSGHQSLVDLLRLVPGASVQHSTNATWSTGIRGRQAILSRSLLVLRDGRQIYDPLYSGTFWDSHDMILQDIDLIEVMRGPGTTLWGSNAVNGVVNIESKSAKDTQGLLVSGIVGDQIEAIGQMRYGGQIDEDTYYRVWAKHTNHDGLNSVTTPGTRHFDSVDTTHAGFRLDKNLDTDTTLTIDSGLFHSNHIGEFFLTPGFVPADTYAMNAYILGRVEQETSDSGYSFQAYIDWYDRRPSIASRYERLLADVEYKQHSHWGDDQQHQLVWGTHYQLVNDDFDPSPVGFIVIAEPNDTNHRIDAFLQNTTTLVPNRWFVTVGSKFEYNSFSQFNIQPNARLWHTPNEKETWWASVSRPVRTPARLEDSIVSLAAPLLLGNTSLENEEALVFEAGHRRRLNNELSVDIALFHACHRDLISAVGAPPPAIVSNILKEDAVGGEITLTWKPSNTTRVDASYSYANLDLDDPTGTSTDAFVTTPQHTGIIQAHHDLNEQWQLHANAYITSNQPATTIGSHTRLDLGLTCRINEQTTLSLWGQNLLDPSHLEKTAGTDALVTAEIPRSFYIQLTFEE